MKKRPSLEELSKMLGVSKSLISFVINNKADRYGISPETKKRVLDTINDLGFQPNSFARSLRTGRSNSIALIVPDISNPFYATVASEVEKLAYDSGYRLFVSGTKENIQREEDLLSAFVNGNNADGIILASCAEDSDGIKKILPKKFPFVLIDRVLKDDELESVSLNNFDSAKEMTQHLLSIGCKKIGLLAATPTHISSIKERIQGFKSALEGAKLQVKDNLIKEVPSELMKEKIKDYLKELILVEKVDAIFALNNSISKFVLEVLDEMKISVPSKLKFASFDDSDYYSLIKPSVSAVAQPSNEIAAKCFTKLLNAIKRRNNEEVSEEGTRQLVLNASLKIRNSTKA